MSGRYFLAITALAIALPASGQDIPMIDAVGAYNHSQVMRHRDGTTEKKRQPSPNPQELGHRRIMALSPESRKALIALKPELDRRTKRDGEAVANRWFEAKVAEAERREGIRR